MKARTRKRVVCSAGSTQRLIVRYVNLKETKCREACYVITILALDVPSARTSAVVNHLQLDTRENRWERTRAPDWRRKCDVAPEACRWQREKGG